MVKNKREEDTHTHPHTEKKRERKWDLVDIREAYHMVFEKPYQRQLGGISNLEKLN